MNPIIRELATKGTDITALGKCIRAIREQEGVTSEELADTVGLVSRPSLTRIESGKSTAPTFDVLFKTLKTVGQFNIVKNGDFNFDPYPKEIKDLVCYFINKDATGTPTPSFKNTVLAEMGEKCTLSSGQWETVSFYAQCLSGMNTISKSATLLDDALQECGMSTTEIDFPSLFKHLSGKANIVYLYRELILSLNTDNRLHEIFEFVGTLIAATSDYVYDQADELNTNV